MRGAEVLGAAFFFGVCCAGEGEGRDFDFGGEAALLPSLPLPPSTLLSGFAAPFLTVEGELGEDLEDVGFAGEDDSFSGREEG